MSPALRGTFDVSFGASGPSWQDLKIGAGGWVTGIFSADDGTFVCRCDVYGGYVYNRSAPNPGNAGGLGCWQQLCTEARMPSAFWQPQATAGTPYNTAAGVYAIAIAPGNSQIIYVAWNDLVFASTNQGASFTQTGFSGATWDANDNTAFGNFVARGCQNKMAVDPNNSSCVILAAGTNGQYETTNGGSTWTKFTTPPVSDSSNVSMVAYDRSSGTTGGRTNTTYIAVSGSGLYVRTSPTGSFSLVSDTPTNIADLKVAIDGTVYVVLSTGGDNGGGTLEKYSGGTWTVLSPPNLTSDGVVVVACDLSNASHIVCCAAYAGFGESTNAGSTWSSIGSAYTDHCTVVANDCPYLATIAEANAGYLPTVGALVIDPSNTAVLWMYGNQAVLNTPLPIPTSPSGQTLTTRASGIEELVTNLIVVPPSYYPIVISEDLAAIQQTNLNQYPTKQNWNTSEEIDYGLGADWASSSSATVVVSVQDSVAVSSNGGATFTECSTQPAQTGGSMACASATNWIQAVNGYGLYVTTTGGTTAWTLVSSISGNSLTGVGPGIFGNKCNICADRVDANTFYVQIPGVGTAVSSNSGSSWTLYDNSLPDETNSQLGSVPNLGSISTAGHLFYTPGNQAPGGYSFYRSTNGGQTWSTVSGIVDVWVFGFGKCAPGQNYPVVFAYGIVGGVQGVYMNTTVTASSSGSWVSISDSYPGGWLDVIRCMSGDPNNYPNCYVGFLGSGYKAYF